MAQLTPTATGDLLKQLAPAHAPPPAGLWPPAPGWWLLALLLIAAIVLPLLLRRRRSSRLRRAALAELKQLDRDTANESAFAQALEHLLRRFAVARYGRLAVAGLAGERWTAFIVAHGGQALAGEAGIHFLQCAYGGKGTHHRADWLAAAQGFIRSRA